MIYVYGILVAVQIVLGQVLWKVGVEKTHFVLTQEYLLSSNMLKLILNPYMFFGVLSYGLATVLYMSLLAKFQYTSLQAVVVSSSLVATFVAANLLFGEKVHLLNLLGLVFLIVGVLLITKF